METEYNEFRLKPAKNGWTLRAFGEMYVYNTDSEAIDALKEHMKQIRSVTARRAEKTSQMPQAPRP